MELLGKIPFSNIQKIVLYENTRRQYMCQIKERTGADYVINGGIYDFGSFKPFCNMKVNGEVKSNPGYTEYGFAWDVGNDIRYMPLPAAGKKNYLGCVGMVYQGNRQVLRCNPDMRGRRQRSAIGICDKNLMLYACNRAHSKTPEKLQEYMMQNHWESGMMLDGGGSTQAMFPNGKLYSSEHDKKGRVVQNYILVFLKDKNLPNRKPKPQAPVCPYEMPTKNVHSGSMGNDARWVQWHLNHVINASLDVDGIFGSRSVLALKKFQSKQKLKPDGICGQMTRNALILKLKG